MSSAAMYKIVGAADCPYFLRAQRLAYLLMAQLGLTTQDIVIESRSPQDWPAYYQETCKVRASMTETRLTAISHGP